MPSPHIKSKHPPHNLHTTKRGYQGSESDDDVKGEGNSYTTFYRIHDPRLGRWFSIDPVFQPWQSPYNSMDNNPIWHNDVLGDWVKGAGFWRNMKSSDGQIKAEDFSKTISGSIVSKANNGDWGVTWTTKETITLKDKEGNDRDKDVVAGNIRIFKDEESNDLTGNAFFRFMGLLDYGVSNMRGSMDNYGALEGNRGLAKTSKGINNTGIALQYTKIGAPVGIVLCTASDIIDTGLDFKTGNKNAWKNLGIRSTTFIIGKGTDQLTKKINNDTTREFLNGRLNHTSEQAEDQLTK
jgi:RHS repeat-associated protein